MTRKWMILGITCLFCISIVACTTPLATEDTDTLNTLVAQSIELTQMSGTLTAVAQPGNVQPSEGEVSATETPTFTPGPTNTPELEGTWLTFAQNTNCRFGPGTSYYLVKTFNAFDQVQAIARSDDGQYAYVTYTDTSTHYCWVATQLVTIINGDVNSLRVITPIPTSTPTITPTPDAGFSVSFNGISSCGGEYYVRLLVKNTGYLTWQSITIKIVDNDEDDTITDSSDAFTAYAACAVEETQDDLTTYEYGIVSNFGNKFDHDIDNHSLTIKVTLYSKDGQSGTAISQTFNVTP